MESLKADPLKSPTKKGKKLVPMKSDINHIFKNMGMELKKSELEEESEDVQSNMFEGLDVSDPTKKP